MNLPQVNLKDDQWKQDAPEFNFQDDHFKGCVSHKFEKTFKKKKKSKNNNEQTNFYDKLNLENVQQK